ncbi:MAG: hypothetical protein M3Q75_06975, partial [Gemmatimonadota bacterium]|nr:hypothetical protein [Gemmatimonadota bacterium]
GDTGSAWVTASAVLGSLVAAAVAGGFGRGRLGPDERDEPAETVRAMTRGLADGVRAVVTVRSVAAGMVALAAIAVLGLRRITAILSSSTESSTLASAPRS